MSKPQKLELTWIGREKQPRLELLLELEEKDIGLMKACWKAEHYVPLGNSALCKDMH